MSKAMEDDQKALVPRLRFPEFRQTDEWTSTNLGAVCDMQAGKYVRASDIHEEFVEGLNPCYGGNGLRGFTATTTHTGDYPLIGRQGALCGNVTFVRGAFHATEHAVVVTADDDTNCNWLFYLLIVLKLNQYATGQAQPGLSVDNLRNVSVAVPAEQDEQQKIADCLTAIDERITATDARIDALKTHKKGLMQQLFPREGETIPRLRFPEFRDAGAWIEKTLGEIGQNLDSKRKPITKTDRVTGRVPYYGASGIIDFVSDFLFDENLLCISEDGANLVARTQPIAFSISGKSWVNNHAHVLRFKRTATQTIVEKYLNSISIEDYLTGMAQPKLNRAKLDIVPVALPGIEEQQKIADCLSSLDELIAATTAQRDALREHKKGMLQQLFPSLDEQEIQAPAPPTCTPEK